MTTVHQRRAKKLPQGMFLSNIYKCEKARARARAVD